MFVGVGRGGGILDGMSFPTWSAYGVTVMLLLAFIVLSIALYWQSPSVRMRTPLEPYRIESRIRSLTMVALMFLLLGLGLFLAAVPLERSSNSGTVDEPATATVDLASLSSSTNAAGTPVSGAFAAVEPTEAVTARVESAGGGGGRAVSAETNTTPTGQPVSQGTTTIITPTAVPATDSPVPTNTPTQTPTPSPTATPFPTLTPTPITDPTATVNTGGSTLWVRQTPGARNVALLQDRTVVILRSGIANRDGVLWQEIETVEGVLGWVPQTLLEFE